MDLKKPLNWDEQIDRLIFHKFIIEDRNEALQILKQINYYRITGYALQFRVSPESSDCIPGIKFSDIYKIYVFDMELRALLLKFLEPIESYLRTQISYMFSMNYCLEPPHDQHYYKSNYWNTDWFDDVMDNIDREIDYNSETLIVKHHDSKYDGLMPLWVLVNLMSFSTLSKYFNCIFTNIQNQIAYSVSSKSTILKNHMHCLSVLRNKCAHGARLYNTQFNPPVKLGIGFLKKHKEVDNDTLFAYIYVLLKNLPNTKLKKQFLRKIKKLIEKHSNYIDFSLIGFPNNYKDILKTLIDQ